MSDRLVIRQLSAERGLTPVFSGLDISAQSGELIQLMGINGSGKSTLLRIIIGLIQAESGNILWNDLDTENSGRAAFQANSVYLGHKNGVAEDLSALENLDYFAALRGAVAKCSAAQALESVAFSASPHTIAGKISAGQKQRIALAKLALTNLKLWLLDEPFTALDGDGKALIENMLDKHCKSGGIAIVATHQQISGELDYVRQLRLS